MSFWSKRIKNNKGVADALNVDESKIKALKDNRLTIGGATMDRTLKAIEDEKINKAIKDNEMWKWILETDFKAKRLEFGYKTQMDVAKKIGCNSSVISRLETDKSRFKRLSPMLIKVYDFYTNDFNKKIKPYKSDRTRESINKDNRHIWKWYKSTDIRALRISMGLTGYDIAHKIGVAQSCISDLELKRCKTINKTMINAYNFYNNNQKTTKDSELNDTIYDWYTSIEDIPAYRRAFGYSLNRFMATLSLSYDQARTFERHEYKSATPVVIRAYNFYHDESKRLDAIEWEPSTNNTFVANKANELPAKPSVDANDNSKNDDFIKELIKLQYKIDYLEKLNQKYETLIDKLTARL
jgi:transcriptional regulator with XRE-family HTH domain